MNDSDTNPAEPDTDPVEPYTDPVEPEGVAEEPQPEIPGLPRRALDTFFSPGKLAEAVAQKPVWAGALILGGLLIILQTALIPVEVWEATFREAALESGAEVPEGFEMGVGIMRISAVVGGAIGWFVFAFIMAGITTLIFSFILGDDGRYKQYLAIMAHAWLIPATVGLLMVPLRIAEGNPQMTLNLGSFFFFLPGGYLLKVLTMLDLSQLWAWLVIAQGAHAIHPKRSFASAAVIVMGFALVVALIFAPFAQV